MRFIESLHRLATISTLAGLILGAAVCSHAQTAATDQAQPDAATFTFSQLANFTGFSGAEPGSALSRLTLVQGSDGNFYGDTQDGGENGTGTVFKITPGGVFTLLHTFTRATDGEQAAGGMIQGTDGNFYGTTSEGGNGYGTLFRITPDGTFTVLHYFSAAKTDGENPQAVLVEGTDGNLYSTTQYGGANGFGTVFKMSTVSPYTVTVLHSFSGSTDGTGPEAGLVQGTDGNFYGTVINGGAHNEGTIFQLTPGGTFTLLHSFAGGATDGQNPYGTLIQGTDGNFYGTTILGGPGDIGTVFKITSGGTFTLLHSFASSATDGNQPFCGLVQGTDGNFYGATVNGGSNGQGTVYSMTPAGNVTLVYSFTGSTDGTMPEAALVQGMDGNLYGTTNQGGANGYGSIFKLAASPALSAPVQISASSTSLTSGQSFTMSYSVLNADTGALPGNMNQCFATNNAGDTTGWTGILDATSTTATKELTASSTPGTYTYSLTCGGTESSLITLTVNPPTLTFTSVTHNFGRVQVGTPAAAYGIGIKNVSDAAYPFALDFTAAKGFTSANNCGSSIAAGASCELAFYFTPAAVGTVSTTWSLTPEAGEAYSPSNGGTLTGSGTSSGGVSLTSAGYSFGTVAVGTTSPAYGTELSNSTSSAVTLTLDSASIAPFTALTNCGTTLAAGASCELEFTFTPTSTSSVQKVFTLSATPTAITSGGAVLPNGGITLSGN